MFIKFYSFEVGVIAAGVLGIFGAALILAAVSFARGDHPPREFTVGRGPRRPYLKPAMVAGAGLIVLAFLVFPARRGVAWTGERYLFRDAKIYEEAGLAGIPAGPEGSLDLKTMPSSRKYAFSRGELILRRNGYVETPFRRWPAGRYAFEIYVRGEEKEGQAAGLIAVFLGIAGRRLISAGPLLRYETESVKRTWTYNFEVSKETVGKVRLQFLNANTETKGVFREVWLTRAEVRKLGP